MSTVLEALGNYLVSKLDAITKALSNEFNVTLVCTHRSGDLNKTLFLCGEKSGKERHVIDAIEHMLDSGTLIAEIKAAPGN